MKKKNVILESAFVFLLVNMIILPIKTGAYAQQPYTKKVELICDNAKVELITNCNDDTIPSFPECTEQFFVFTDLKTGESITKRASGSIKLVKDATGRPIRKCLDALATSWACVKGETQLYLLVGYYTGGNCNECEWFEIYEPNGKSLSESRGKNIKEYKEEFKRTYNHFGLPKTWPTSSFIYIKLSRNN
jgi:hypothetical protein